MLVLLSIITLANALRPMLLPATPKPFVIPPGYFYEMFHVVDYSLRELTCSVCTDWITTCPCRTNRCCTTSCSRFILIPCTDTAIIIKHNMTYCSITTARIDDNINEAKARMSAMYPLNSSYGVLFNTHKNNSCTTVVSGTSQLLINVFLLAIIAMIFTIL